MKIRSRIGQYLLKIPFIENSIVTNAGLKEFTKKPAKKIFIKNLIGVFLIIFSYIIGWPAVFFFGFLAVYFKKPLIVIIGGPAVYGLSHLVFAAGMFLVGVHYSMILLKWITRLGVEKLIGKKYINSVIKDPDYSKNEKYNSDKINNF